MLLLDFEGLKISATPSKSPFQNYDPKAKLSVPYMGKRKRKMEKSIEKSYS